MNKLNELAKKHGCTKNKDRYLELDDYYFTKVNDWKDEEINVMEIGVFDEA